MKLTVDPCLAPNSNSLHVIHSQTSEKATSTKFNTWRIIIPLFIQSDGFQTRSCCKSKRLCIEDKQQTNLFDLVRIVKVRHKEKNTWMDNDHGMHCWFVSLWENLGSFKGLLSLDENYLYICILFIYFFYLILVP